MAILTVGTTQIAHAGYLDQRDFCTNKQANIRYYAELKRNGLSFDQVKRRYKLLPNQADAVYQVFYDPRIKMLTPDRAAKVVYDNCMAY